MEQAESTDQLDWLSDKTNRSLPQTKFLYALCNNDFEKLKALEVQVKNCFVGYCPGDKETVDEVLRMKPESNYFKL